MVIRIMSVLAVAVLSLFVVVGAQERKAVAVVNGETVKGNITFVQQKNKVLILGKVIGLEKGLHGFHVHEKGDLSNGCASTGSHFNPDKKNHGSPEDRERHTGDLGNIEADENGVAVINKSDDSITLIGSRRNVIGRAVVIHSGPDDLGRGGQSDSLTTGHAGGRVACGVIGTLNANGVNMALAISATNSLVILMAIVSSILAFKSFSLTE